MGKSDTTVEVPSSTPTFTPSYIKQNGEVVAKTYKDSSGNVVTEYLENDEDKALREWREQQITELEPQINVFSDNLQNSWKEIAQANEDSALKEFNSLWDPIVKNTREDLWARGLQDSSVAVDTQKAQDEVKADAIQEIATNYVSDLKELENNELSNRYMYLNYLSGGLEDMSSDAYNLLAASLTSNDSVNSNNANVWKTQLEQYNYENSNSGSNGWFTSLF